MTQILRLQWPGGWQDLCIRCPGTGCRQFRTGNWFQRYAGIWKELCSEAKDEKGRKREVEDFVFAFVLLGLAVFYWKVLSNYGKRNILAIQVFLCLVSRFSDLMISVEVGISWMLTVFSIFVLVLELFSVPWGRILTYYCGILNLFILGWPILYGIVFPYNNMREDIMWAVFSIPVTAGLCLSAAVFTAVLYILNRKWWKLHMLRGVNIAVTGMLVLAGIIVLLFGGP